MSRIVYFAITALLLAVGLGLLYLTNSGLLSFGKPYIIRESVGLQHSENTLVAFVNVNVVPMDRERLLENQTVIVRDGVIEMLGDNGDVDVPGETLIVEGKGKYLMPGLADMHVHIKDENDLLLFVANGVTTVRDMWGTTGFQLRLGFPDQLALREQINQERLFGPTLHTAGPIMEGPPATMPLMPVFRTPEEAEKSVAWQAAQGYDFVKVYDQLSVETYQAVLRAAQEHDLPVIGHAPKQVGLDSVLAGGQISIEHLTGYIDPDAADFIIPEDTLAHYAELTRESDVWNCPTIGIYQKLVPDEELERVEQQPGMEYLSPRTRVLWKLFWLFGISQGHGVGVPNLLGVATPHPQQVGDSGSLPTPTPKDPLFLRGSRGNIIYEGSDYPARIAEIYTTMTKVLHDAGARIILGTDAGNPYVVPGFSLHDELGYLVDAGFTPYEAIEAGTRNAAEALGRLDEFGTIAEGKRADLILAADNPLEDVANVGKRAGVMLRGLWLPEAQLQEMLDELANSYTPTLIERVWPISLIAGTIFLILRRLLEAKGSTLP